MDGGAWIVRARTRHPDTQKVSITMQLQDKRFIVTGAASGMGREIAIGAMTRGAAHVALFDINADALAAVRAEVAASGNATVSSHIVDLRSGEAIRQAVDDVAATAGGIDTLVNAAGVLDHLFTASDRVGVDTLDEAAWDAVMDVNLKAPWLLTKAAAPYLRASDRGPSIVNFASVSGMAGSVMTAYGVSKAALIQLTRGTAITLGPHVRANAISPGSIRTPMAQSHLDAGEDRHERALQMYGTHIIPRMGEVSEIVNATCFLASDEASFITGVNLPVDGGTMAWRGRQKTVPID